MATLYLDFLNGNDANNGSSFANRFKTFNSGATAARTAPGDTIRLMKSEDPIRVKAVPISLVSSTNASPISVEVTGHGYTTGDQVEIAGHATNTAANGAWTITVTDANNFTLNSSTGNGVGGATGTVRRLATATFTDLSPTVTLSEAVTKTIEACESSWTANTNVTASTVATRKEGSLCSQLAVASGFTTGRIGHKALAGATDYSAYTKITLWIRANTAVSSGVLQIKLCSDTGGTTAVNTITINEALSSGSLWRPIVLDNGGALGSSIQSVALYALSDPGTVTIALDNIEACNELSLVSLISTQSSATSLEFWPVQSINGTTVKIDASSNFSLDIGTNIGYVGATASSVAIYKRDPVRITSNQATQEAGSSGNPNTYSGGWDTAAMTSQDGMTFIDVADGSFIGVTAASDYINFEKLVVVRGTYGFNCTGGFQTLTSCGAIATGINTGTSIGIRTLGGTTTDVNDCMALCGYAGNAAMSGFDASANLTNCTAKSLHTNTSTLQGFVVSATKSIHSNLVVEGLKALSSGTIYGIRIAASATKITTATVRSLTGVSTGTCNGVYISTHSNEVSGVTISAIAAAGSATFSAVGLFIGGENNVIRAISCTTETCSGSGGGYGVVNSMGNTYGGQQNWIYGLTTTGAKTASIYSTNSGVLYVDNTSCAESTKVVTDTGVFTRVIITRYEGDPADYRIFEENATVIRTDTGTVDTGSSLSIKHSPLSAHTENRPLLQKTMPVVVNSSGTLTLNIRVQRSSTNVAAQLRLRGGQANGVASDLTDSASASAGSWETLSINCSPTQKVPMELELLSWQTAGSGDVFWDTASITQS